MRMDRKVSNSSFAHRLLALFGVCVLLPIVLLTVLTLNKVTVGMEEQHAKRLQDMAKTVGMSIYERLMLMDSNLKTIASELDHSHTPFASARRHPIRNFDQWFLGIASISATGGRENIYGKIDTVPDIPANGPEHDEAGKTMILTTGEEENVRIFMIRRIDSEDQGQGFLAAEINSTFLWGIGPAKRIPLQTNICVIDQRRNILINSLSSAGELLAAMAKHQRVVQLNRSFTFSAWETDYFAGYWSVFMRSSFAAPNWIVILSQEQATLLQPLNQFKKDFGLVILLSILIVILLSMVYIRRSMVPLHKLKEGTNRLAHGDFTPVEINGRDEFADLADSFNRMSSQLSRQFSTLRTIGDIDRAVLSSLDTKKIVATMLGNMCDFLHCRLVAIATLGDSQGELSYYLSEGKNDIPAHEQIVRIEPEEIQQLLAREYTVVALSEKPPPYLAVLHRHDVAAGVIIPLTFHEKLAGILVLGYGSDNLDHHQDDITHACHLAVQLSVALANSHLVLELEKLSWGAIQALGRSVDAKSSWTAGHSDRVTSYALQIGQALPLTDERLQILHRAALLHDIGKIGIPASVLDKPSRLTEEEYEQIKNHPEMGARILEPLTAFKDIIPIILQHHERFDGSGYPDGLCGDEIILEARILAVADVFDALFSSRPYRNMWNREKIVAYLEDNTGVIFDPQIATLFLTLLERDEITINPLSLVEWPEQG